MDRKFMFLSLFVATALAAQVGGCAKKSSTNSRGPADKTDGAGDGADGADSADGAGLDGPSDGSADGEPAAAKYEPKGGDHHTLSNRTKVWETGESEPEWSEGTPAEYQVVALYKSDLSCKYRMTSVNSAFDFAFDIGCEVVECQASSNCTTKDIASEDVGAFDDAKGQETTCQQVVETTGVKTLLKSVTRSWSHDDALREGLIVKSETLSCSLPLDDTDDVAAIDACQPPEGRSSQLSRSEQILTAQTRGEGTPDLTSEAKSAFKATGAFVDPDGAKSTATNCSLMMGKLNVSMTKTYCTDQNKADIYTFALNSLPSEPISNHLSAPYTATLSAQGKSFYADATGACKISYDADEPGNMLSGSATCTEGAFKAMGSPGSVSVSDVSFSCFAPAGFFD